MKNGVPFDVAFGLDSVDRAGFSIIFSEMEGSKFNWHAMKFDEDK